MDHKQGLSTTEELVGLSNNNVSVNIDAAHVAAAKGKRTKRLRLLSSYGGVVGANNAVLTSSCSSASGGSADDQGSLSISSTTTTDQEEEDMANCLILLAQGGGGDSNSHHQQHHLQQQQRQHQKQQVDQDQDHGDEGNNRTEIKGRKISEVMGTASAVATTNKVGLYIYECKTCNRTFPSFQALGGHRASHKKPKLMAEEKKPPPPPPAPPAPPALSSPPSPPPSTRPQMMNINHDHHQFELGGGGGQQRPHIKSVPPINPISLQFGSAHHKANNNNFNGGNNNSKAKIHECSICGSEFTSGQALGGHMRRHRASTNTTTQAMSGGIETTCNAAVATSAAATVALEVQPRNILELDLNLPAPEEDLREPKFQFTAAATQKSMVLSAAPALVDCHY